MSTLYRALVDSKNPTNVLQYSSTYNARNHYPSIINTGGDNLFLAWVHYGELSTDITPCEVWARTSNNNGISWSEDRKIISIKEGKLGPICPSLYKKVNGNIICIANQRNDDGSSYWGQLYQYESTDNGLTWDEGKIIFESSVYETNDYIWTQSNNILVTLTGRLIISITISTTSSRVTNTMCTVTRQLYSDDEGVNWSLSDTVLQAAASGNEALIVSCSLTQLSNGTIIEVFRTRSRFVRITKSTDNGVTWTNPPTKSETLITSNADLYVINISDILYAFASRPSDDVPQLTSSTTRVYLDLWKSTDGGDTWTFVKNLLYDSSVHAYTEPIVYDSGLFIYLFYSYYPYDTTNGLMQDLRFEKYTYSQLN